MKCKDCIHDMGYRAGMIWPPYKPVCKIDRMPVISLKGDLYNRKCKKENPAYKSAGS